MYPAALAIVVARVPGARARAGRMAVFFGVAGGLTAIGPILGGFLSEWTWRAIFWVNVPVAIVALVLTAHGPAPDRDPARIRSTCRGLVLVVAGASA